MRTDRSGSLTYFYQLSVYAKGHEMLDETNSSYENEEIIMVPVPRSALRRVYEAIASPAEQAAKSGALIPVAPVLTGSQSEWTADLISRLDAELTYPGVRVLLTLAAERAPRPITFAEAAAAAGVQETQLRGQLGALTKIVKRLLGGSRTWPLAVRFGDNGEAIYTMDRQVAEWWLATTNDGPR
jgi:hypothetical protein